MPILWLVLALLIMLFGLVGILIPVLPGAPLIFLAALGYGLLTDFSDLAITALIWLGALAAISLLLDWLPGILGVKKYGGSILGMAGALAGMAIGLVIFSLPGLILGSFFGAVAGEMLSGKNSQQAMRAGLGSLVGFFVGTVFKLIIGVVMVGIFVWQVVF